MSPDRSNVAADTCNPSKMEAGKIQVQSDSQLHRKFEGHPGRHETHLRNTFKRGGKVQEVERLATESDDQNPLGGREMTYRSCLSSDLSTQAERVEERGTQFIISEFISTPIYEEICAASMQIK